MPIHEYRCLDCGNVCELLVGIGRNSDNPVCRSCGGSKLEQLMSVAAVSVKPHLPSQAPGAGSTCCGSSPSNKGCTPGSCCGS